MNREIFVYLELNGKSLSVGRLWSRVRNGRESATFQYEPSWLARPEHFALEPALQLVSGPFQTQSGKALFGAIGDSAPDGWGRTLMQRAERARADRMGERHRTLFQADLLLGVDDETRLGALRFKTEPDGVFLAGPNGQRIPPLVELPRLLSATERYINEEDSATDLRMLLAPAASLGGARPKASILDRGGYLALAKFQHHRMDDMNVVLWEGVALSLAQKAGINVPEWRIECIDGKHLIILRRFDRVNGQRIPFLSAMSMLKAKDRETHSYMEIADAIRQYGNRPKKDMAELWRRMLFNLLIFNTDNHLRNFGFLYSSDHHNGWHLSPAYDMNPVPSDIRRHGFSTTVDNYGSMSMATAIETANYYGVAKPDAKRIAAEVAHAVQCWREAATGLGVAENEASRMKSAFEHENLETALNFAR